HPPPAPPVLHQRHQPRSREDLDHRRVRRLRPLLHRPADLPRDERRSEPLPRRPLERRLENERPARVRSPHRKAQHSAPLSYRQVAIHLVVLEHCPAHSASASLTPSRARRSASTLRICSSVSRICLGLNGLLSTSRMFVFSRSCSS